MLVGGRELFPSVPDNVRDFRNSLKYNEGDRLDWFSTIDPRFVSPLNKAQRKRLRHLFDIDDWLGWEKFIRSLRPDVRKVWGDPFSIDLRKWQTSTQRYIPKKRLARFYKYPTTVRRGIELYMSVLPQRVRGKILRLLTRVIPIPMSRSNCIDRIKKISELIKKNQMWAMSWFKLDRLRDVVYFLEMERMFGFTPEITLEELRQKAIDWFGTKYMDDNVADEILECLDEWLEGAWQPSTNWKYDRSVDDFARDPLSWATSGAGSRTKVRINKRDLPNVKWNTALFEHWKEIAARIRKQQHTPRDNMFIKREQTKSRGVVTGDEILYLQMSYVLESVDLALKNIASTLYMNPQQKNEFWEESIRLVRARFVSIPIDQSAFDHKPSMRLILGTMRLLARRLPGEKREIMLNIVESIRNTVVRVGDENIMWTNGVLSGWRMTAMIDTVINIGELLCARKRILHQTGHLIEIRNLNAQGDDDNVVVTSFIEAAALTETYAEMGLEVNPKKFFVMRRSNEYLRKAVYDEGVFGLPSRLVTSVLWSKPGTTLREDKFSDTRARIDTWNKLIGRGCDKARVQELLIDDTSGILNLSPNKIKRWYHTPASLGGIGVRPFTKYPLVVKPVVTVKPLVANRLMLGLLDYPKWYRDLLLRSVYGALFTKQTFKVVRKAIPNIFNGRIDIRLQASLAPVNVRNYLRNTPGVQGS